MRTQRSTWTNHYSPTYLELLANAVEKLAQQQVVSNEQLNESVREQRKEQEEGKQVLLDTAHASHQNIYQHILATIPYYDGTSGDVTS